MRLFFIFHYSLFSTKLYDANNSLEHTFVPSYPTIPLDAYGFSVTESVISTDLAHICTQTERQIRSLKQNKDICRGFLESLLVKIFLVLMFLSEFYRHHRTQGDLSSVRWHQDRGRSLVHMQSRRRPSSQHPMAVERLRYPRTHCDVRHHGGLKTGRVPAEKG